MLNVIACRTPRGCESGRVVSGNMARAAVARMIQNDPTHDDRLFTDYCDAKTNWGPLLPFRPSQHERLGVGRTLAMSVLLGFLFGVPGSIVLSFAGRLLHRPAVSLFALPMALTAVYFMAAWLTFVPAWNRRAVRLARSTKR